MEGPLDQAVLDEYASAALDAAGVAIVPIHGTRNMQGLIDGELTPRLGIKVGLLTDDTVLTRWTTEATRNAHAKKSGSLG